MLFNVQKILKILVLGTRRLMNNKLTVFCMIYIGHVKWRNTTQNLLKKNGKKLGKKKKFFKQKQI